MSFTTDVASTEASRIIELIEIRTDSGRQRWTTSRSAVTWQDHVWTPAAIQHGEFKSDNDLGAVEVDIAAPARGAAISEAERR